MDIFSIFTLCGGLAFFLYGMMVMSAGLEKIAGGKMEKMLEKMKKEKIYTKANENKKRRKNVQITFRI